MPLAGLMFAGSGLLTTAILFIDGGPAYAFSLLFGSSLVFIGFLNMFGLTFLLIGISGFATTWHRILLYQGRVRVCYGRVCFNAPFSFEEGM